VSEIERYLDELFDRLAGTGAAGRRALAEAEDHLRASAAAGMVRGLPADRAELDAAARFGSPAVVAAAMRSALGGGRASRAVSAGWLLAGLAAAGLGVAWLTASGRLGWQSPSWACSNFLSPSCYSTGEPAIREAQSAVLAAAAGTALLLGRWLAVRHGRLAPVHRGFVSAAGLAIGLVAFGFGMSGRVPALPGGVFSGLPWLPPRHVWLIASAAMLMDCLAAVMGLAGSAAPSSSSGIT
jgi:hypothetical protein